jgi:hypothetical protein
MSVLKPDRPAERGPDGRWLRGVVPKGARPWQPGVSANPGGEGGLYHEMQRLAREFTPAATRYLIEIAQDRGEDTRNRIVAMSMLYERAWGKPKEFDPNAQQKPPLNLESLPPEDLATLRQVFEKALSNGHHERVLEHEFAEHDKVQRKKNGNAGNS